MARLKETTVQSSQGYPSNLCGRHGDPHVTCFPLIGCLDSHRLLRRRNGEFGQKTGRKLILEIGSRNDWGKRREGEGGKWKRNVLEMQIPIAIDGLRMLIPFFLADLGRGKTRRFAERCCLTQDVHEFSIIKLSKYLENWPTRLWENLR